MRRQLVGTALATKQTELKALSELDARKQVRVLDAILADDLPDVGNVAQALEHLAGTLAANPLEKRFMAVSRTTGARDLLGFLPGLFGLTVIEAEYAELIDERLLEDHIEELLARKQALASRRKDKR